MANQRWNLAVDPELLMGFAKARPDAVGEQEAGLRERCFRELMARVLERSLYQTDYYAWTKDQAAKLRALRQRA